MLDNRRLQTMLALTLLVCISPLFATAAKLGVSKEVDQLLAPPSAILSYTITVANVGDPALAIGLFTDYFPDELAGCAWTCSETGSASCEMTGGTGDIYQLISVPVGSSVIFDATCTFAPSPGYECAANSAEFFTMDPDTLTHGHATTCDSSVTVFFDGFESGDSSRW